LPLSYQQLMTQAPETEHPRVCFLRESNFWAA
jgi:hypothetical protein